MPLLAAGRQVRLVGYLGGKAIGSDGFLLLGRAELRHLRLQEHLALLHLLPLGCLLPQRSHLRMPCVSANISRTAQLPDHCCDKPSERPPSVHCQDPPDTLAVQ